MLAIFTVSLIIVSVASFFYGLSIGRKQKQSDLENQAFQQGVEQERRRLAKYLPNSVI